MGAEVEHHEAGQGGIAEVGERQGEPRPPRRAREQRKALVRAPPQPAGRLRQAQRDQGTRERERGGQHPDGVVPRPRAQHLPDQGAERQPAPHRQPEHPQREPAVADGGEIDGPGGAGGVERSLAHPHDEPREDQARDAAGEQVQDPSEGHHEGAHDEHDLAAAVVGEAPGQGPAENRRDRERPHHDPHGEVARVQRSADEQGEHRQGRSDRHESQQAGREQTPEGPQLGAPRAQRHAPGAQRVGARAQHPRARPPRRSGQATGRSGWRAQRTIVAVSWGGPPEQGEAMPATASRKQKPVTHEANEVVHRSIAERTELGKRARERAPRSSHAVFEPAPDRPDPVALLEEQSRSRVPELVPIRYGRMLVSPFTFYRGAAEGDDPGPLHHTRLGPAGAVLRRRPPVQLRRLRLPRAAAGVRHQRLRRDAPGPLGVGRQATRGEPHDRLPGQRLLARRRRPGGARMRSPVPPGDADLRGNGQPRRLVRTARRRDVHGGVRLPVQEPGRSPAPRRRPPRPAPATASRRSPN